MPVPTCHSKFHAKKPTARVAPDVTNIRVNVAAQTVDIAYADGIVDTFPIDETRDVCDVQFRGGVCIPLGIVSALAEVRRRILGALGVADAHSLPNKRAHAEFERVVVRGLTLRQLSDLVKRDDVSFSHLIESFGDKNHPADPIIADRQPHIFMMSMLLDAHADVTPDTLGNIWVDAQHVKLVQAGDDPSKPNTRDKILASRCPCDSRFDFFYNGELICQLDTSSRRGRTTPTRLFKLPAAINADTVLVFSPAFLHVL